MSNNNIRLNPEYKVNEEKIQILDSKEFLIKSDSKTYHTKIEINTKYIFFNVGLTDRIIDSSYQNKYDLNAITRLLNLSPNKYTNLNQVLKFIEKAYSINKIKITQDELNLVMGINMPMGFEEEEYKLTLYKTILSNNDIINQIVKELNLIKKVMKANGYNNYDIENKNNNMQYMSGNDNFHKKLEELNNKINYKDSLIIDLNKKMAIKDKEIKDIYSKLIDKDVAIKEMNKTLKKKESNNFEKERIESINQLKIKDEEINKKLNDKAFELNNKLIDKDNALNEINKKLIEKDYLINEINNKLESQENQIKRLNEAIKELKLTISKLLEENSKFSDIKDIKEIKTSIDSTQLNYNYNYKKDLMTSNYNTKINNNNNNINSYNIKKIENNNINKYNTNINTYNKRNSIKSLNEKQFSLMKADPNNLKYKYDIVNTNTKGGLNDIFEVFTSIKDNQAYLISPNKLNYHLDIITLNDNKFYASLKGHQKKATSVRYFLNEIISNEYLISSDDIGIIFVWDITNSYKKLFTINTKYNDIIYSCLLVFERDNYENDNPNNIGYIVTSTYDISKENQNSATKIYSMENGEFINYIKNTNANSVFYLLSWYNKKHNKNYIIQFCFMKILICGLFDDDEVYAELSQEQKLSHYSGFVYEKEEEDKAYLYSSSKNGFINIWDLYNKILVNNINITGSILCHIIQWDEKYAIVADYNGKSFKIINLENLSVEKDVGECHTKEVKSIKKIRHPHYGDCLLTAGNDQVVKLWCT